AVVGADRIGCDSRFGRPSLRSAIAAIVQHEHAVAVGADGGDLAGAASGVASIAGEIKERRLAFARRQVPGDKLGAVGRLEHDFLDAREPGLLGRDARAVGDVDEIAVQEPGDDADQRENTNKREEQVQHGLQKYLLVAWLGTEKPKCYERSLNGAFIKDVDFSRPCTMQLLCWRLSSGRLKREIQPECDNYSLVLRQLTPCTASRGVHAHLSSIPGRQTLSLSQFPRGG